MSKKKKSIPRPRRKTVYRPWLTSDADVTVLELEQAKIATGVMAEAIRLAQREHRGCHYGDHQTAEHGGVAGWVLTHKLPWGMTLLAARLVCCESWRHFKYPTGFHAFIEARHMLVERPIRRRRRDWTFTTRQLHCSKEKYSEAGAPHMKN